jgi:L-glyceraldehyde 3-phosphate reductase
LDYRPDVSRYEGMTYKRCGRSGLDLPAVSLGLWHNFGSVDVFENSRAMVRRAFDLGITHFDLANNYGPLPGSAEETFGRILKMDLSSHRDELVITSKAGWDMWPGPYGDFGSRKYLVASLDQSLRRMGLSYVDIFYHHRPDPKTPLEETMGALDFIVRSGRALYAGISSYQPADTAKAATLLRSLGTPCLVHQPSYSIFNRWIEGGLLGVLEEQGMGCVVFSALHQGLLSDKYLNGIPADSRAGKARGPFRADQITPDRVARVRALNELARRRGQSLAQMAVAWVLRQKGVTSAILGASHVEHVDDGVAALKNASFSIEELREIDAIAPVGLPSA